MLCVMGGGVQIVILIVIAVLPLLLQDHQGFLD